MFFRKLPHEPIQPIPDEIKEDTLAKDSDTSFMNLETFTTELLNLDTDEPTNPTSPT